MRVQKRVLGRNLTVSAVGLGCMGFSHAYGAPIPEHETIRLMRSAADISYNFFDTAEIYGTPEDAHANETAIRRSALTDTQQYRNINQVRTAF